jgi:hypothetical protein
MSETSSRLLELRRLAAPTAADGQWARRSRWRICRSSPDRGRGAPRRFASVCRSWDRSSRGVLGRKAGVPSPRSSCIASVFSPSQSSAVICTAFRSALGLSFILVLRWALRVAELSAGAGRGTPTTVACDRRRSPRWMRTRGLIRNAGRLPASQSVASRSPRTLTRQSRHPSPA